MTAKKLRNVANTENMFVARALHPLHGVWPYGPHAREQVILGAHQPDRMADTTQRLELRPPNKARATRHAGLANRLP